MYFFVHQEQPQPPTGQLLPRDQQQEPLQQDNHSAADLLQQHRQLLQLGEMLMKIVLLTLLMPMIITIS